MTIDKSLKVRRGATRNRSVLTRVERIARLQEADRWKDGDSPLGLPKVRVRKLRPIENRGISDREKLYMDSLRAKDEGGDIELFT